MNVGTCKIHLRLPENGTLKDKRQVSRSLIARVRNKFNVAIAEVEDNDAHEFLTLGISCVSNNARHANQMLSNVADFIQEMRSDAEVLDYEVDIMVGV